MVFDIAGGIILAVIALGVGAIALMLIFSVVTSDLFVSLVKLTLWAALGLGVILAVFILTADQFRKGSDWPIMLIDVAVFAGAIFWLWCTGERRKS